MATFYHVVWFNYLMLLKLKIQKIIHHIICMFYI